MREDEEKMKGITMDVDHAAEVWEWIKININHFLFMKMIIL